MVDLRKYKRKFANGSNNFYFEFDSINDFLKVAEIPKEENELYNSLNTDVFQSHTNGYGFCGTDSFKEAVDLIKHGWDSGAEEIVKRCGNLNTYQTKTVYRNKYDVVGGNACVARYLQGVPTNMVRRVGVQQKAKILNLYRSIEYSAMVDKDRILEDAKITAQIIYSLEAQGYRCNLYVINATVEKESNPESKWFVNKLKVKDASQPLNLKKIAFPLSHPSMLRRLVFRLVELTCSRSFLLGGYGFPLGVTKLRNVKNVKERSEIIKNLYKNIWEVKETDIFIPTMLESAEEFIDSVVANR